jgi:hypothetical protein
MDGVTGDSGSRSGVWHSASKEQLVPSTHVDTSGFHG